MGVGVSAGDKIGYGRRLAFTDWVVSVYMQFKCYSPPKLYPRVERL